MVHFRLLLADENGLFDLGEGGWDRQHPLAHCELNGSLPSSARTLCYGAGRLKIVCTHVSLHHLQIHMYTLFVHTEIFFKEFWSHLYISASSTDTFRQFPL